MGKTADSVWHPSCKTGVKLTFRPTSSLLNLPSWPDAPPDRPTFPTMHLDGTYLLVLPVSLLLDIEASVAQAVVNLKRFESKQLDDTLLLFCLRCVCVCVCVTVIWNAHSLLWRLALASHQELWDLLFWWKRSVRYSVNEFSLSVLV